MNKKVLTLCAGFLLAGSLTATAQYCPNDGEVPYRTRSVKAAMLDENFTDVYKINSDYRYQLQVQDASATKVLTVERDYSTGKLYLTSRLVEDATLTHSLWNIVTSPKGVHGQYYSFVNLETGYKLTMDHTNALKLDGNKKLAAKGNESWTYLQDGLLEGCNDLWELYSNKADDKSFGFVPVYSYFHNGADSVMFLAKPGVESTLKFPLEKAEKERVGVTGKKENVIVTLKEAADKAGDLIGDVASLALKIRPVIAGAKVLNAAEINTMIDADGSYLSFVDGSSTLTPKPAKHIGQYNVWADAVESANAGKSTKFMVVKPGSKELVNLAVNPLAGDFVAENSPYYDQLKRENYGDGSQKYVSVDKNNAYAGYDILFREKNKSLGDAYKYLMVSEKMYDGVESGAYTGLKVETRFYSHIKNVGVAVAGTNELVFTDKAVKTADYNSNDKIVDPLEARYHWKVTYYPSNDSVVFEPLNASRFSETEYNQVKAGKLKFENSRLANAASKDYFNTVNEGKAVDKTYTGTDATYNSMYHKFAGVPVALYAFNNAAEGDAGQLLTINVASGNVEAALEKYAAVCKFDKTNDNTKTDGINTRNNPAFVTNKTKADAYVSAMNLRVKFNNNYTYLTRATVKSGLYFMNLVKPALNTTVTENRVNGAYIVDDMKGHVVYDTEDKGLQKFNHMPATQWVVEQQPCDETWNATPTVVITNREFGNELFKGQLYVDKDGRFFTLNHRDYVRVNASDVDRHGRKVFNCADYVAFNSVNPQTTEGFFNEKESVLRETTYKFEQLFDQKTIGKFLGLDASKGDYLTMVDDGTEFELYRANGWHPVKDKKKVIDYATGTIKEVEETDPAKFTYSFVYNDSVTYGYASEKAGVKSLYKTFFKVKVKDENLIDNDHTFLAIRNQHDYVLATEKEIADSDSLTFAIVTFKENNCLDGVHGYAIITEPEYQMATASLDKLTGLKMTTTAAGVIEYKDDKGNVMVSVNPTAAKSQVGKLNVQNYNLQAKIADLCNTSTEAFALVSADRKLYRTLDAAVVNNAKKVIDLVTIDEQGNESLYEDSGSKLAKANKLNYLAAENLGNQTKREGIYVDKVAKSKATMPQYLLVVAADSVPAYKYCEDGIHGINPGCGHEVEAPGYVEGRFLVNFNDSIKKASIDKLSKRANAFKADNFVRLGFVEGIHRGDNLYILKNTTLASIKKADKTGKLYVDPMFFEKDNEGKKYDVVKLDGKHNNAAFSFRETGDAVNSVMIESNDINNKAKIGSFGGAWIKIHNNIPVLSQWDNLNGDHNTGDSTDSWKVYADLVFSKTQGETINQAARFTFNAIDKDASATANETIATSDVTVSATNGAVVVKGAAGKAVVVTNILGQTLANTVISSDNASISVPAGIVVVAVEGEEAVKVVVK